MSSWTAPRFTRPDRCGSVWRRRWGASGDCTGNPIRHSGRSGNATPGPKSSTIHATSSFDDDAFPFRDPGRGQRRSLRVEKRSDDTPGTALHAARPRGGRTLIALSRTARTEDLRRADDGPVVALGIQSNVGLDGVSRSETGLSWISIRVRAIPRT